MLNMMVHTKLDNGGWILGLTNAKGSINMAIVDPDGTAYLQSGDYSLRSAIKKAEEMLEDFSDPSCDPSKYNFQIAN